MIKHLVSYLPKLLALKLNLPDIEHKSRSLLLNVRALHTISKLKESDDDVLAQIINLVEELKLTNFVVLGRLFSFLYVVHIIPHISQHGQHQQSVFYCKCK